MARAKDDSLGHLHGWNDSVQEKWRLVQRRGFVYFFLTRGFMTYAALFVMYPLIFLALERPNGMTGGEQISFNFYCLSFFLVFPGYPILRWRYMQRRFHDYERLKKIQPAGIG